MKLFYCLSCGCRQVSSDFTVLCICSCVALVSVIIVWYLYERDKMLHIQKLSEEEKIRAEEFDRKKDWEKFLHDMEKEKEESIAARRDETKINENRDKAISYAKSIILLSNLLHSYKPLSAFVIEEEKKKVDSFLEMVKSLSDDDMLKELLNKKQI